MTYTSPLRSARIHGMKLLALGFALLVATAVRADDGWIGNGGTPTLMSKHQSISMDREVVKIFVGREKCIVDCQFWFTNLGRACTARMGFPDYDEHRYEHEDPVVKSVFDKFESWVDGRPAKTKFISVIDAQLGWQAKDVKFGKNQTRLVRDRYTVTIGSGATNSPKFIHQIAYTLHTGASWKGPIGKVDVEISFDPFWTSKGLKVEHVDRNVQVYGFHWDRLPTNFFVVASSLAPKLSKKTIRFSATNLEPGAEADIDVYFGPTGFEDPGLNLIKSVINIY